MGPRRDSGLAEFLDEGWIKVGLKYLQTKEGSKLFVQVEDSGNGFNYQQKRPDLSDNVTFGGRGIPLVRSLCKEVTFHGNGSRVLAVYEF